VPVPALAPNYTSHSILQENSDKHDSYYVKRSYKAEEDAKSFLLFVSV
jgi:hypothetical protein